MRLFGRYSWNLNDTPGGRDDEINPDVLGYIFEKYINQKEFGAYYTRPEITGYLSERTIFKLVLDRLDAVLRPAACPRTAAASPPSPTSCSTSTPPSATRSCSRSSPRSACSIRPAAPPPSWWPP